MFQSFKNSDIDFSKLDENNPYFHVINAVKLFFPMKGLKVLDIGCGREQKYQVLGNEFARLGCLVLGVDQECKAGGMNPRFIRSSIDDFKTKGTFDVILSSYFFGYVTKDWAVDGLGLDAKKYELDIMKKIYSMLRQGGLTIHYMNEHWALEKEDLERLGFEVIKLAKPVDIFRVSDGLCILRKN